MCRGYTKAIETGGYVVYKDVRDFDVYLDQLRITPDRDLFNIILVTLITGLKGSY
ncbi:MAG: hypothetical protein HQL03_11670 [Nitrospirae bacterium]|nr:hypothetical protein [Nitrospirota bacterium]MBF0590666.1 hypothetical protein [Nitrospirota bacterium]